MAGGIEKNSHAHGVTDCPVTPSLSSLRHQVVFARQPPLPAPADPSLASAHLRTLSVPLSQFLDTRYLIPVFGAPYYEAAVVPSPDGGLPQRSPHGGVRTGLLKIWFNEGGGITFRDAVEEVKSRREEGSRHGEALRTSPVSDPNAMPEYRWCIAYTYVGITLLVV